MTKCLLYNYTSILTTFVYKKQLFIKLKAKEKFNVILFFKKMQNVLVQKKKGAVTKQINYGREVLGSDN